MSRKYSHTSPEGFGSPRFSHIDAPRVQVIGPASTMVSAFAAAFAACKRSGLKVAVTTSHSAPYQVDAPAIAVELVKAWASDGNLVRIRYL